MKSYVFSPAERGCRDVENICLSSKEGDVIFSDSNCLLQRSEHSEVPHIHYPTRRERRDKLLSHVYMCVASIAVPKQRMDASWLVCRDTGTSKCLLPLSCLMHWKCYSKNSSEGWLLANTPCLRVEA